MAGLVIGLATPSGAAAQSAPTPVTGDRFHDDLTGSFGMSLSWLELHDDPYDIGDYSIDSVVRFDIYGQYMTKSGFGVFGLVPVTIVSGENFSSRAGNVEVSALQLYRREPLSLLFRVGLVVPVLGGVGDADLAVVGAVARWTDLPHNLPEVTWVRMSATPILLTDWFFVRGDVGVDIPVATGDLQGFDDNNFARVNAAVGSVGSSSVMLESTVSYNTADVTDQLIGFAALSYRMHLVKGIEPYMSLQLPLDEEVGEMADWTFILGFDIQPNREVNLMAPIRDPADMPSVEREPTGPTL